MWTYLCLTYRVDCNLTCFVADFLFVGPGLFQSSSDAIYLARHIGLYSKVPLEVPALTVNRLCGSSFQSVINGAQVDFHA